MVKRAETENDKIRGIGRNICTEQEKQHLTVLSADEDFTPKCEDTTCETNFDCSQFRNTSSETSQLTNYSNKKRYNISFSGVDNLSITGDGDFVVRREDEEEMLISACERVSEALPRLVTASDYSQLRLSFLATKNSSIDFDRGQLSAPQPPAISANDFATIFGRRRSFAANDHRVRDPGRRNTYCNRHEFDVRRASHGHRCGSSHRANDNRLGGNDRRCHHATFRNRAVRYCNFGDGEISIKKYADELTRMLKIQNPIAT
uniref:Uncharacterized protein n=1 Tax=Romanomermis culicivorax TaxID=13658 RepID=A0A915HF49_ROMCU